MMKIKSVHAWVEYEDETGDPQTLRATAPTIELVIEKLGAIERKLNKENGYNNQTGQR